MVTVASVGVGLSFNSFDAVFQMLCNTADGKSWLF